MSDVNGKIWVASTTDGKDWAIVKEELSLTGSVSSMVVKDGTLNFYYAKDGALHLATASAADGWVDALTDAGQVLQLPDGVNNGTVVYNDVNNQFQSTTYPLIARFSQWYRMLRTVRSNRAVCFWKVQVTEPTSRSS